MAITNGYCTLAELRSWVSIRDAGDTAADTELENAVTAASREIDRYCNRRFWKDGTDTTRTYQPGSTYLCAIDDLVSITSLKTDAAGDGTYETTWSATDYQLLTGFDGFNAAAGPETRPYRRIEAVAARSFPMSWTARRDRVQVIGIFGWPNVPAAVKQACLIRAAALVQRKQSTAGVIAGGDFGAIRVSTRVDGDVAALLEEYRLRSVMLA